VPEAPWEGGMRVDAPFEAVESSTVRARICAAEILSDWGDAGALPLMRDLLASADPSIVAWFSSEKQDPLFPLKMAIVRTTSPDSAAFLRAGEDGLLRCCRSFDRVYSMVVRRTSGADRLQHLPPLDEKTSREVWSLISNGPSSASRGYGGGGLELTVYFHDGLIGHLAPIGEGRVIYTDNTRLERTGLTIENPELHDRIMALATTIGIR